MSLPVAGRRRGQAVASAPTEVPSALSEPSSTPNWLFDDEQPANPNTVIAPLSTVVGVHSFLGMGNSSAAVATHSGHVATEEDDPLSFLDFGVGSGVVSAPPPPSALPPSFLEPEAGLRSSHHALDSVSALNRPIGSVQPSPVAPAPSFLNFDDDNHPPVKPIANALSNLQSIEAQKAETIETEWRTLYSELVSLDTQLRTSQGTIDALVSGSHELCSEYASLEEELRASQASVDELNAQFAQTAQEKEQREAEIMTAQHELVASEAERHRLDLVRHYSDTLSAEEERVSVLQQSLSETQKTFDHMQQEALAAAQPHEQMLEELERRLSSLITGIRTDYMQVVKPLLSHGIREQMAEASQQRMDILFRDQTHRRKMLHEFRLARGKAFTRFQDEHRLHSKQKVDRIFGELHSLVHCEREKRQVEVQGRLSSCREDFEAAANQAQKLTHDTLSRLMQTAAEQTQQVQKRQKAEQELLAQRRSSELQHFLRLWAEERRSAVASHEGRVRHDPHLGSAVLSGSVTVEAAMRDAMERLQSRLGYLRQAVRSDTYVLKQSLTTGPSCASSSRDGVHSLWRLTDRVTEVERQTECAVNALNSSWALFKSALSPLEIAATDFERRIQELHIVLLELHEDASATRRAWEEDVKRDLSRILIDGRPADGVDHSDAVELPQVTMTSVMTLLSERIRKLLDGQQELRDARMVFAEGLGAEVGRIEGLQRGTAASLNVLLQDSAALSQLAGSALESYMKMVGRCKQDNDEALRQHANETRVARRMLKDVRKLSRKVDKESRHMSTPDVQAAPTSTDMPCFKGTPTGSNVHVIPMRSGVSQATWDNEWMRRAGHYATVGAATTAPTVESVCAPRSASATPTMRTRRSITSRGSRNHHDVAMKPAANHDVHQASAELSHVNGDDFSTVLMPIESDSFADQYLDGMVGEYSLVVPRSTQLYSESRASLTTPSSSHLRASRNLSMQSFDCTE